MKLYLVRHGETNSNIAYLFQDGTTELSERGIKQTKFLAQRFHHLPIDIIIASPYQRAKNTAEEIHKVTNKEIIFTDLLVEMRRPSEFFGQSRKDPKLLAIKEYFESMYHDPDYHYTDEENFHDLKNRAQKFLDYLATLNHKSIAVVSHQVFLIGLVGLMTFGKDFSPTIFLNMYNNFMINNTGLTVCERKPEHGWDLITWNDHAHLAEVEN